MIVAKTQCPLTGKACLHLRHFGGPCSESPTLGDATTCIGLSAEHIEDLSNELSAMDDWVDQLRGQSDDGSKGDEE